MKAVNAEKITPQEIKEAHDESHGSKTYLHKFKCMACGLHFILCSWLEDREKVICPECANAGNGFLHWLEVVPEMIACYVPGNAQLVSFGLGKGKGK